MLCQAHAQPVDYEHAEYKRVVQAYLERRGRVTTYDRMRVAIPRKLPMLVVYSAVDGLILESQIRRFLDAHQTENTHTLFFKDSPHVTHWAMYRPQYERAIDELLTSKG